MQSWETILHRLQDDMRVRNLSSRKLATTASKNATP